MGISDGVRQKGYPNDVVLSSGPKENIKRIVAKNHSVSSSYNVAVKGVIYKGKVREMAVVYEEITDKVKIITIHPLKNYGNDGVISFVGSGLVF